MADPYRSQQSGLAPRSGRANYTTLDEIPMGEEVLVGMFFLNERPIIILFDSRASHGFMSLAFVERAKLTLVASRAPYVICTPGGQVDTNRIAQKLPPELSRRVFSSNVIVLSGQGIDGILGMSWMKLHMAILDISARLVQLNPPVYGKVTLHLLTVARFKASLHHVVERRLEDICIV
jgi:hypothetical protein